MHGFSFFRLVIGSAFLTFVRFSPVGFEELPVGNKFTQHFEQTMKHIEKLTLIAATAAYAGYLVQQAIRTRSERLFRLAAGESPYERTHPKPRASKKVLAAV